MPEESKGGPSLGAVLDWVLKLAPFLGTAALFLMTLYTNQAAMIKHDDGVDRRLADMDKERNERDRLMAERLALMDAAIAGLKHDLQFYEATRGK